MPEVGHRYEKWTARSEVQPHDYGDLRDIVLKNREFSAVDKLQYGDYGLTEAYQKVSRAIRESKRIALYADYDVDGTMSCVAWIWFFEAIGFDNFVHYIPDRFKEGYGLNLQAVQHLIENEKADLIITMDTGITANTEAAYCRDNGVEFICTDHHKIQEDKMPDCTILNPKMHPDERYQELCGCGITFVLLRKLGDEFPIDPSIWLDILSLTGMATICDVVPLNGVNHRLARMGVDAIFKSKRVVLKNLLKACAVDKAIDEKDIGFRLGPRINAVGRLEHANLVVEAFTGQDSQELIQKMGECNDRRKTIQGTIVQEASELAMQLDGPVVFCGGDWHQGVVGIAASKVAESNWKPTWLFQRGEKICKGSARSIPGFDVTAAMMSCGHLFDKFGGHSAAGGFSFPIENEEKIKKALTEFAKKHRNENPDSWRSQVTFDCELSPELVQLELLDCLQDLKPFGHGFDEPSFAITLKIKEIKYYNDKMTGEPKHTAIFAEDEKRFSKHKVMFFNEVVQDLNSGDKAQFIVNVSRNEFRGRVSVDMYGIDWRSIEGEI